MTRQPTRNLTPEPHGKQISDEFLTDDALEPPRWWPMEGFGRGRPELDEPRVRLYFRIRQGVEYAEDLDYEVTDADGRPIATHVITKPWNSSLVSLTVEPDEHRRTFVEKSLERP